MWQILVVDGDADSRSLFQGYLNGSGHKVTTAESYDSSINLLGLCPFDVATVAFELPDGTGIDLLRAVRRGGGSVPVIVVGDSGCTRDAVCAMRAGAYDFLPKSVSRDELIRTVNLALDGPAAPAAPETVIAHAAARWARSVVAIVDSPRDPRNLAGWSRWVAASPGAIRNWCRTVGIPARRSLVFARLLRAVCRSNGGRRRAENLLDVVDRRTLSGLLAGVGLGADLPGNVDDFLDQQTAIRDADILAEIRRVLREHLLPTVNLSRPERFDGGLHARE